MFRVDSSLGNCSRTLNEILAAKRSWPKGTSVVDSSLLLSQAPFGRHFRKCESNALCWFGTSMNWMELAANTRQMPTILVVSVEAAEMQYDSIETSEIS